MSNLGKSAPKGGQTLETIQILRAAAVIAVVVSHASHELTRLLESRVVAFNEKAFPGDFGVDLFFVISGFIMVYVSRNAFGRPGNVGKFIKRRLIRVVPLYWLMTTAMIAVILVMPDSVHTATRDPLQWLFSYLFIPHERMTDGLVRPVLGLGWSLEYEMYFYALFALGLFLPRKYAIPLVCATIALVCAVGAMAEGKNTILHFFSRPVTLEFAAGAVIGWFYLSGGRLPMWFAMASILAGLAILFADPAFDALVEAKRHIYYGIPALLIVSGATLFRNARDYRAGRPLLLAGDSSYATYLVHPFVLGGLALGARKLHQAETLPPELFAPVFILTAIASSLIAGYLVHRFVDEPMRRGLGRIRLGHVKRAAGTI